MGRYALIDTATNVVVNTILIDDLDTFTPPTGTTIVQSSTAQIGDSYNPDTGVFTTPPPPPPPEYQTEGLTAMQFLRLFTSDEQDAVNAQAQAQIAFFGQSVDASNNINLAEGTTQDGVNGLVGLGVLTQDRANVILSGAPAPQSMALMSVAKL